jgi:hypothetical protein
LWSTGTALRQWSLVYTVDCNRLAEPINRGDKL